MYNALNKPEQLKGWTVVDGDPCEQSWTGIECSGSSVIHIKLHGLELKGYLGDQLSNLHSLKILDISSNGIEGVIPDGLPPNVTQLNLSSNKFVLSIPHTLHFLRNLRHLNLSHNMLSGPIGSVFEGLENLKEMDLSYNKFSGDLPSSFKSLKNLTKLYLENNVLTGSVVYLGHLNLTELDIRDNHFSGIIPQHFQTVPYLWIGGNNFTKVPNEQSISSPPIAESSAIEKKPYVGTQQHKKKGKMLGIITLGVGGTSLVITLVALVIAFQIKHNKAAQHESLNSSKRSICSFPVSSNGEDQSPERYIEAPQVLPVTPPVALPRISTSFPVSTKGKVPPNAKHYRVSEILSATNNFSEENFLGEGSLGSVYKAKFADGQARIFAVKNINMVPLSFHEEDQFLDVVRCISRLQHPNIVPLVGYSVEHEQHLLVYEHVRNLTLDKALHCKFVLPLTWDLRIQIAVGVAQALDYMHSLSPPIAHCNLKAANIMLDDDLRPRVCDSGLSILRPLTSNNCKVKASEMAISDCGYIPQEHGQTGIEGIKTDVYAFGVLLLELLTGRRPFDSSRPTEEQSLVKWASCRLHDYGALEDIVDPILRRSFSAKALSRCADIISLCVQPDKEFRPQMSEIADALTIILPKPGTESVEVDAFEKSFRSTNTRFLNSPETSYVPV
ncbi:Protein STRUBBELIG-RECEPTOR FAMILY 2 [Bienertia sinuspersici]